MMMLWCILAVIFVIAVAVRMCFSFEKYADVQTGPDVTGKTVWLLWWQGWEDAPWLVSRVRESWQRLNSDWNIQLLTRDNLMDYLPKEAEYVLHKEMNMAARSDIIRLNLLARHGGVWADATMLCMMPLDSWIYDAVSATGFWMYHGRELGGGAASWFIVSMRQSYIIQEWTKATNAYWQGEHTRGYFWMDSLFGELTEKDSKFAEEWRRTPYIWAEAEGQAHMLAGRGRILSKDKNERDILTSRPPYVVKLSHHAVHGTLESDFAGTNASVAIQEALTQEHAPYPMHSMVTLEKSPRPYTSDTVAVLSVDRDTSFVADMNSMCQDAGVQLLVYDRCGFGKAIPDGVYCRPLRDVGRQYATYLHFIISNYFDLPAHIMFIAGGDVQRLRDMIRNGNETSCTHQLSASDGDFTHNSPAQSPNRPLRNWYERHIGGRWSDPPKACWGGIMRSSRERILKKNLNVYINIYADMVRDRDPEDAHFMERCMESIF